MITTPDIIPNNLRVMREMRGKSTYEISKALGINRSYISVLENNRANMSGITAFAIMSYLDVNYYQLFEKKEVLLLDFTEKALVDTKIKLLTSLNNLEYFKVNDIISVVNLIQNELDELDIKGKVYDFKYIEHDIIEGTDMINVKLNVTTSNDITTKKEFDLNLSNNINIDLYKALILNGFNSADNKDTELYNIEFIEKYLGIKKSDTQEAIGISEEGYNAIISGKQKISVKIMWRLVKYFNVPLEYIVNIDLYNKLFINTNLN